MCLQPVPLKYFSIPVTEVIHDKESCLALHIIVLGSLKFLSVASCRQDYVCFHYKIKYSIDCMLLPAVECICTFYYCLRKVQCIL